MTKTTAREARRQELNAIFEALPGTRPERLATLAAAIGCPLNSVRIYLLKTDGARVMPAAKLEKLRLELLGTAATAA